MLMLQRLILIECIINHICHIIMFPAFFILPEVHTPYLEYF